MSKLVIQPRKMNLQDPRHWMRFLKSRAKLSPEEIAKAERVSVATVKDSIRMCEQHAAMTSQDQMDMSIRGMVITAIPKAMSTLSGLLDAEELVEMVDPNTGKKKHIKRADKTTRLEAVKIVSEIIKNVQPKVPLANVNVNQTTQVAASAMSSAETTEERLRRLREKAREFAALPPEVAGVPEAIDAGGSAEDDDEDSDEEDAD